MNDKFNIILRRILKEPTIILKLLKAPFMSSKQVVLKIYQSKKKEYPDKSESEYLRYVLITRPPFDYQDDDIIDGILKKYPSIDNLSSFIERATTADLLWKDRNANIKARKKELCHRNMLFLRQFYGIVKHNPQ